MNTTAKRALLQPLIVCNVCNGEARMREFPSDTYRDGTPMDYVPCEACAGAGALCELCGEPPLDCDCVTRATKAGAA